MRYREPDLTPGIQARRTREPRAHLETVAPEMEMADKAKGRFVWFDLMTSDQDAAIDFYGAVTGWGTSVWDGAGPDMKYTMWTVGEQPIGGVMDLPPDAAAAGAPPSWLAYIGTEDVDATAKKIEVLGGRIVKEPMDIPTVGRFAVAADPQGAIFAIFTAQDDAPGHDGEPRTGEFSWHELVTTDYEAAFRFYSELFGWDRMDEMDMGPAGIYLIYGRKGIQLGGMFNKTPDMPMPPMWMEYAMVDDVDAATETVKARGGQILNGPMEVPGGDRIVQCMDPQGAMFALHSRAK